MQITQLNVITEIPFDFSQKYQTAPRPNCRSTVYFGTQLISVIGILLKQSQCGPCQSSRFLPASPAFYAKCPSKNILQVGRSDMSHDHDTRQAGHFKNMYCRTTLKSMCLSIRGPVMWNKLHSDLKNSTNVNMFNKRYKTFLVSEYRSNVILS